MRLDRQFGEAPAPELLAMPRLPGAVQRAEPLRTWFGAIYLTVTCDRNAAANLFWYPEERENRIGNGPRCVEMGDQWLAPVPVSEA
jgi:hypothetical protein